MAAAKSFQMWVRIYRFVDADTFTGQLDQGYGSYRGTEAHPVRFRIAHINAPELKTPEGPLAKAYAEEIAPPGTYPAATFKPDEYGRLLVDLLLPDGLFSEQMLAAGHAVKYR